MGKKRKQQQQEAGEPLTNGGIPNNIPSSSPAKKIKFEASVEDELVEVSPDLDITGDDSDFFGAKEEDAEVLLWDTGDLEALIANLETQIPENDMTKFSTTLNKINWDTVKFGSHSSKDCLEQTTLLLKHVRRFRTLTEVLVDAKVIAKNPHRNVKTGRIVHPDMPKRPMTPFLKFFTDKRAKFHASNPEMGSAELSKLMASKFAELSEKKQLKYRRRYEAQMAEYREKMEQFRAEHPELYPPKPDKHKAEQVGPEKPKKPFAFYLASRLKKYEGEDQKEATEKIKESWSNLSETKRLKWIKKALKDEQRYETELAEYVQEHPEFEPPKVKSTLNKTEMELKHKADGRPDKPPASGYTLYCTMMMSELTDVPAKEKLVIIGKRWKELSAEERAKYNDKAQRRQAKYVTRFDAYLQQLPEAEKEKVLSEQKLKMPSEKKLEQKKKKVRQAVVTNAARCHYQAQELMRLEKEHPGKAKAELMLIINKQWDELSDAEKDKYMQVAESLKQYLPANKKAGTELDDELVNKKKPGPKKDPMEPEFIEKSGIKRPAKNGFTLFYQENQAELQEIPAKERMGKCASAWKNMTEAERQTYGQKAREMNSDFNAKLKLYKETGQLPPPSSNSSNKEKKSPVKGIIKSTANSSFTNSSSPPKRPTAQSFFNEESSDSDSD